jgi:hypothetical protein
MKAVMTTFFPEKEDKHYHISCEKEGGEGKRG